MPTRPKRPCSYPGCPVLVPAGEGRCEKHKRQEQKRYDSQRGTAAQRGYGARWQRYRKWYLARNPLCVECEKQGRIKAATDVDHIKAVSGPNDPKFWDPENHESMCHECHSAKTARENGGFGNG